MSDIIGSMISGAATLKGAQISAKAQTRAGKEAAKVQRETNAMQVDLANTSHQREIADLKAAGLNPLLSGTGGAGASTPTLQAPTQEAEGRGRAGQTMGNALSILPTTIMQFMTGQQQIELTRQQAEKTKADADLARIQGIKTNTETGWMNDLNQQSINESKQRVTESTIRTQETQAKIATMELMRIPEMNHILQQIAESTQRTKTEQQRTIEQTAAANNAKTLYGSRASEAETIAKQAAINLAEFYRKEKNMNLEIRDLETKLLNEKIGQAIIQNILDNEYGRMKTMSEIFSNPTKWLSGSLSSITDHNKKVQPTYEPGRYKGYER